MKRNNKAPKRAQPAAIKGGELIRRALVDILAREDLRDPALHGVSITISEVKVSPDLRHAIVYAAPLGGRETAAVIVCLNKCSSFLRGKLGQEMTMRSTPALKFESDTTFDTASELQELLSRPEIARDLGKTDLETDDPKA